MERIKQHRSAAAAAETRPAAAAHEGRVDVVRQYVETPVGSMIEAVVARPRPVAVTVDEGVVDGEEPERAVDVEQRREREFELVWRRLVRTRVNSISACPRRRVVLGLDLVGALVGDASSPR